MDTTTLEPWRHAWRTGVAPLLSRAQLEALRGAIVRDDQALIQGGTTTPPPMLSVQDWPVESACALGYCGWKGSGLGTVGEVNDFFAKLCAAIDRRLGEEAGCAYFLRWHDDVPREEMLAQLLPEVDLALSRLPA